MMSTDLISSPPAVKVPCEPGTSCCDVDISRGSLTSSKEWNTFSSIHTFLPQIFTEGLYEYSGAGTENSQISTTQLQPLEDSCFSRRHIYI